MLRLACHSLHCPSRAAQPRVHKRRNPAGCKRDALRSVPVADLTPTEVIDAVARLMNGDIDPKVMSLDELYRLAEQLLPDRARDLLYRTLAELNDRGQKFDDIGERLGVHGATAARWAKPPSEDRRKRRTAAEIVDEQTPQA